MVTATGLEAWAARSRLPAWVRVERAGIGLSRRRAGAGSGPVILCGLAGALSEDLAPGSVVIPDWVGLPGGERFPTDPALTSRLREASRGLGWDPCSAPVVTLPGLATGPARQRWAACGFGAAEMEAALVMRTGAPTASVRVILDGPRDEISQLWKRPVVAAARPWLWPQTIRLAIRAPGYALKAASIVAAAI